VFVLLVSFGIANPLFLHATHIVLSLSRIGFNIVESIRLFVMLLNRFGVLSVTFNIQTLNFVQNCFGHTLVGGVFVPPLPAMIF